MEPLRGSATPVEPCKHRVKRFFLVYAGLKTYKLCSYSLWAFSVNQIIVSVPLLLTDPKY